jgi:hypothetical protein
MSLFCLKRFIIAIVTAVSQEPISISILIYTKLSIFTIGYTINQKPYLTKFLNYFEVINECMVLVTGYYMIIFSEWMFNPVLLGSMQEYQNDPELKYNYGFVYIIFLSTNLILNLAFIIYEQYRSGV